MKKEQEKIKFADRGYVFGVCGGFLAAVGIPLAAALLIAGGPEKFTETFNRFGALFGAAFILLYLLFRGIARAITKKKKDSPDYFKNKMTVWTYEKSLGIGMILFSGIVGLLLTVMSVNLFWVAVIGFPGLFTPFSRFLLTEKPAVQNDAGVIKK